jgi:hypothetical protein
MVTYKWSLRDEFTPIDFIIEHPRILCIGAQWLGEKRVSLLSEWEHGRAGMLEGIHALFSEADAVAGYNSRGFDTPWVEGEFAREGMTPTSPFMQVDLYREAKRFRYPSHKLQYVSTALGLSGKLSTGGFGLWKAVLAGDEKAQARMARYCKQDVRLTGELYERMLPWLKTAPNQKLYVEDDTDETFCPKCQAESLVRQGFKHTMAGKYQAYRCSACGGWSQGRKNLRTTETRSVA